MSLAGDIRKLLALEEATIREVADRMQVQTRAELRRVRNSIYEMEKSGVLETVPGSNPKRLRLRPGLLPAERGEGQEKIWRAVKVQGRGFTVHDLVLLAGTARDYTQRYLRFLAEKGCIEEVGRKQVRKFGLAVVYRIAPGKDQDAPPRWHRRAEEKMKKAADRVGFPPALLPAVPLAIAALAKGVQDAMQDFAVNLRTALAMHNGRVEELLREMEADVARIAGPESATNIFPPGWDEARVQRVIEAEEKEMGDDRTKSSGPDES